MSLDYDIINYKNKDYAVICINYKPKAHENLPKLIELPVVVDVQDLPIIKKLNKKWKSNKFGFISCSHTYNNQTKEVYLHEIVMALKLKDSRKRKKDIPILHVNNIKLDNRRENLIYNKAGKDEKKNSKKKKRTVNLPSESGISPNELPTYVWYMKPNGSHGDRFMVDIGDVQWKTTSSKKLSLRYKLEEAKTYLRQLKRRRPDLFEDYSMNGDYTKKGKKLIDDYYSIVHLAGYDHIEKYIHKNKTNELLKPGKHKWGEGKILKSQGNFISQNKKRRVLSNLPKGSSIKHTDIPKYSYYRPASNGRGDFFVVEGHPAQKNLNNKSVWHSTSSKKVSLETKFKQLQDYLRKLDHQIPKYYSPKSDAIKKSYNEIKISSISENSFDNEQDNESNNDSNNDSDNDSINTNNTNSTNSTNNTNSTNDYDYETDSE